MKDDLAQSGAVSTSDSKGDEIQLKHDPKHNTNTFYVTARALTFFFLFIKTNH